MRHAPEPDDEQLRDLLVGEPVAGIAILLQDDVVAVGPVCLRRSAPVCPSGASDRRKGTPPPQAPQERALAFSAWYSSSVMVPASRSALASAMCSAGDLPATSRM